MRRVISLALLIALATPLATLAAPAMQQQEQQEGSSVEGELKEVDVAASSILVETQSAEEITLKVTEETEIVGPQGPVTLADLANHAGETLRAEVNVEGEEMVAVRIELVA